MGAIPSEPVKLNYIIKIEFTFKYCVQNYFTKNSLIQIKIFLPLIIFVKEFIICINVINMTKIMISTTKVYLRFIYNNTIHIQYT